MFESALVSGATGFLGSRLVSLLLGQGVRVTALTRPSSDTTRLASLGADLRILTHPGNTPALVESVKQVCPDVVFHLATQYSFAPDPADIPAMIDANVSLTAELLEASVLAGVSGFVNTSTFWQNVTGEGYRPNCLYAATKQAAEDLLVYYCSMRGLAGLSLVLYDVYGPNDPRPKLFSLLQTLQKSGESLDMTPGLQIVDFVHVDDVCAAFLHAGNALSSEGAVPGRGERYAVSGGSRRTLRDVVALYGRLSGAPPRVRFGGRDYRPGEVMSPWVGEPLPGWQPRVPLEVGLAGLLESSEH